MIAVRKLAAAFLIWLALVAPALAAIGTPLDLGHNQTTSATGLTITTGNAITAGDMACVLDYTAATGGLFTSAPTDTAGNTYVQVYSFTGSTPAFEIYCSFNSLAMASSSTITTVFAGAVRHGIDAFTVSGIGTTSAAFDKSCGTPTGTATSSGTLTVPQLSVANELVIGWFAGASDPGARTWGTGFTGVGGNTATAFALPAYLAVTVPTTFTFAPSWVNSVTYRTGCATFKGSAQTSGGPGMGMTGAGN